MNYTTNLLGIIDADIIPFEFALYALYASPPQIIGVDLSMQWKMYQRRVGTNTIQTCLNSIRFVCVYWLLFVCIFNKIYFECMLNNIGNDNTKTQNQI